VLACGAGGAVLLGRALLEVRGVGPSALLRRVDPRLAGAFRSALELGAGAGIAGGFSPELVRSHALGVGAELRGLPPRRVIPWAAVRAGVLVLVGAVGVIVCV